MQSLYRSFHPINSNMLTRRRNAEVADKSSHKISDSIIPVQMKSQLNQVSSRISSLPKVIFQLIFGEYCDLWDIAPFDEAVCNYIDRAKYFYLLENMTIRNHTYICPKTLRWMYMRKVYTEYVGIQMEELDNDILTSYPLDWSRIKVWYFDYGPIADADIIVSCLLNVPP